MTDRFVSAAARTAADQAHVDYAFLVTLNFLSETVRVFNGLGQIVFNGQTFSGVGKLGSISAIGESTDLRPLNPIILVLAGVDPLTLQYAETRAEYFGRSVRIDIAIFDTNLQLLTPIENAVWEGSMDTVLIERDEKSAQISLTCENDMAIWNRSSDLLYSDEHQRALVPGDAFFDHVAELRNKNIKWGGHDVIVGSPSDPGRGGGQHRTP